MISYLANSLVRKNPRVLCHDSSVVRASASGAVGRAFAPRPRHFKGGKNGTGISLAYARNKGSARKKQAGGYP